jgi:hypothetical protein
MSEEEKIVAINKIVLNLMIDSLFQITIFIEPTATRAEKAKLPRGVLHNHVDLPPLVSVEATGVCIPIGNSEVLLASVYKSAGLAWSDADITELLSFKRKSILAGDLNAEHPFWNSAVSNPSGEKLWALFDLRDFEISAPQSPPFFYLLLEMVK